MRRRDRHRRVRSRCAVRCCAACTARAEYSCVTPSTEPTTSFSHSLPHCPAGDARHAAEAREQRSTRALLSCPGTASPTTSDQRPASRRQSASASMRCPTQTAPDGPCAYPAGGCTRPPSNWTLGQGWVDHNAPQRKRKAIAAPLPLLDGPAVRTPNPLVAAPMLPDAPMPAHCTAVFCVATIREIRGIRRGHLSLASAAAVTRNMRGGTQTSAHSNGPSPARQQRSARSALSNAHQTLRNTASGLESE